jgi:DNA-binding HxlR family transcriptional regulator
VLHTFGLILPYRRKQKVFYAAEATTSVEYAEALLTALRKCVEEKMPIETMIRQATAFTHQRRIEIVRALSEKSKTPVELAEATGITSSALARHLDKLEARGIIEKTGYQYSLACPQNSLGQTLLQSALSRKY